MKFQMIADLTIEAESRELASIAASYILSRVKDEENIADTNPKTIYTYQLGIATPIVIER